MLFWIFVIVCIVFGILAWAILKLDSYYKYENIAFCSFIVSIISFVIAGIMLIAIIVEHANIDGKVAAYQKKYESLVYQMDNNLYENDNDYGKKELYDQVTSWNTDLANRKVASKDLWVGIFYADIYDQFEFIEFK